MVGFLASDWGSWASAIGVIVSLVGFGWAVREARGARSASQAAQKAAKEAAEHIVRHLQAVDLERAIGLIQRIKLLHDTDRWQAAMEQYQSLRMMLSDIIARCPENQTEFREKLAIARTIVRDLENFVGERINQPIVGHDRSRLNQTLNDIQSDLEELASSMGFGSSPEEI
jgi:exonuclease VII small subunit